MLTELPLFQLHFDIIFSILSADRLDRIRTLAELLDNVQRPEPPIDIRGPENEYKNGADNESTKEHVSLKIEGPLEDEYPSSTKEPEDGERNEFPSKETGGNEVDMNEEASSDYVVVKSREADLESPSNRSYNETADESSANYEDKQGKKDSRINISRRYNLEAKYRYNSVY